MINEPKVGGEWWVSWAGWLAGAGQEGQRVVIYSAGGPG